jgi:TP901 family phage tail tape measure protein
MAEVAGYVRGLGGAAAATRDLGGELEKLGQRSPQKLHDIELAAAGAGAALLGLAGWAVKASMEFDRQMSEVSAVSGATADQLGRLRQAALDAGKATAYSADESAKAEAELAKAGLSTADILGGALSGSLSLAAAGQLGLAEAADVAAKSMNIFELRGGDVAHIADVLAASANKSATNVHEVGEALRMGGLAAHTAGLSLEDTVGTLSAFADHALIGSDAGTSLKTMLQMLANPTDEAASLMQELGLKVYDAQGKFVGIEILAGQLQTRLGGLTQEQRQSTLATIFGSDATRAATVLYGLGSDGIREYIQAVDDSGAAQRAAAEKTNNLAGDVERLRSALETLTIESGSGVNGGLRELVQILDHMVSSVSQLPGPVQSAAVVIGGLTGAALLAAAGWLKMRGGIRDALGALRDAGPAGARAASGLSRVGLAMGRVAAAMTAVQLASAALAIDTTPQVEALSDALAEYGRTGKAAGEASRILGDQAEHLDYFIRIADTGWWADTGKGIAGFAEGISGLGGVMDESLQHANEAMAAMDQALAQLVQSGRMDEAKAAFGRLAEVGERNGVSVDELTKALPLYATALDQAAKGADHEAQATADAARETDLLAGSLQDAIDKGKSLKDVFDQLNGKTLGLRQAQREAEAAVDDLGDALKQSNGSLDIHTEKGRRAAEQVDRLAEAAAGAASATLDQTGSVDEARASYDHYIDQLRKTLRQAGYTRDEVDKLVESIASMPSSKTIRITAQIATNITNQVSSVFQRMQRAFGGMRWGGVVEHARDGLLSTAGVYSGGQPLYAFAEPDTGGEAFVPRRGDRSRSLSVLSHAAGWYGAQVMPAAAQPYRGGSGGGALTVTVPVTLLDPTTGEATRRALVKATLDRGVPAATVRQAYP